MAKLLKTPSLKLMSEAIGPSAGIADGQPVLEALERLRMA
jgi:hypothetical protein